MGRHEASLPRSRRLLSAALGSVTVLILVVGIWNLGTYDPAVQAADATTTIATSTPSTVSPTSSPTTPETPPTTRPTTIATEPSTTRAPSTTATTIPTTTTTTLAPLVLEPDGLGVVDFGAAPDEVISEVSARLGPATSDSGWVNARGNFGTCPGNLVRVTRWESLRLYFGDGPTQFAEEGRHFYYYIQTSAESEVVIDLRTATGIGIGASVESLKEAYPGDLVIESTVPFGATFYVDGDSPGLLSGLLTESVDEGQVSAISGGFGCGA